jgi:chromosome segregation protein
MYLKKLSIQGFKSFATRTTFEFQTGITAIVGPNGSGKSNVADALRWVLGEQSTRLLRARKLEDVIFSGTPGRAPVGMAEVLLTLDNADRWLPVDFAEVEIGRRTYRSGESEYLLNGSRVRLRDITDLLMRGDVGQNSYSIMGQGLVDEVLSMSPDERRSFLDEAADVKRFRLRITDAQQRLAATRDNIERVQLIVGELEPRLAQLNRQAQRAAEHRALSAELLELLKAFYAHRWNETQNSIVRTRAALDQAGAESAAVAERVEAVRDQLRALGEEIRRRRDAVARRDALRAELEQRVARAEQAIAVDRERHGMLVARREELRVEIETLEGEKASLTATGIDDGRRSLEVRQALEEARAMAARARDALDSAERVYSAARARAHEIREGSESDRRRMEGIQSDIARATRRLAELEREAAALQPRRKQLLLELVGYARDFAQLRQQTLEAEFALGEARNAAQSARERYNRVQDELRHFEAASKDDVRELDRLEGRLEALRRVQAEHDGVAAGTRNALIMGQALVEGVEPGTLGEPAEVDGVVGLVARQMRVPAGLEVAINAALEHRLHAVVVHSEDAALQAIELLRQRRHGRAQFIALDALRQVYPLNLQKERGVVGVASKLVRCEPAMRPLVDTLLGRVIIVEDIQAARMMIRRALGTVVTLDGTYIEQAGLLTGGATGADEGSFVRQRELEDLPMRIAELRRKTENAGHRLEQAMQAAVALAAQARAAEEDYEQLRRIVDRTRSDLERQRERLHRLRREMDAWKMRRLDITRERERNERARTQAEQAAAQIAGRQAEREADRRSAEDALREATAGREAALRAVSEASSALAAAEGERRALESLRQQHEQAVQRIENQVNARRLQARNIEIEAAALAERMAGALAELEAARTEQARSREDVAPDRDELTRLEAHERQVQDEYSALQAELLVADRRRLDLEAEVARFEGQLRSLQLEMEREGLAPDRTGAIILIDDASSSAPGIPDGAPAIQGGALVDVEATQRRIEEVRRQIRRLGPVNAAALEDYRESKERYDFLTSQLADLEEAEAQLRVAIAELGEEIRSRFEGAFTRVNAAFGDYFAAFFGGGSARLILVDPESPGDSGIEIEASPPGKRIKSLAMLSGGERSLTAVALLFALLTVNPAPFCVLDEVDAALDEANVGRFTASLKQLAERTQFIVITHNRRSVEVADAIYGVSMAGDGVSKVLSLRLADVPEAAD